jgi:hypothetical protein
MKKLLNRIFGRAAEPPVFDEPVLETTEKGEAVEQPDPESESSGASSGGPWIGVDLDGTLAYSERWKGPEHIGKPVPLMMERVRHWIAQGYTVKIMTARASVEEYVPPVQRWLEKHGLPELEVTCRKDFNMIELWDDRGIQVIPNTGQHVLRPTFSAMPQAPILPDEAAGVTCHVDKGLPGEDPST